VKKTVLVTGASGFIGQQFCSAYAQEFNVIPVCLIKTKVEDLDFQGVDAVLHLAALVHQMKAVPAEKYFEVNAGLTEKLAVAAKHAGVQHFVFFSTIKVYGEDGWFDDANRTLSVYSQCHPNDPYGASKLAAEEILHKLQSESFAVAVVRPPLVYGQGVKGNLASLIRLLRLAPVVPLLFPHNRRSVVSLGNLLEQTAVIIKERFSGTIIPQDSAYVSMSDVLEGLNLLSRRKRKAILLPFPKVLVSILFRLFPALVTRMFGSLAFKLGEDLRQREYFFLGQCVLWAKEPEPRCSRE
jgi:nucleoside-diphosphate-sugar epimerase